MFRASRMAMLLSPLLLALTLAAVGGKGVRRQQTETKKFMSRIEEWTFELDGWPLGLSTGRRNFERVCTEPGVHNMWYVDSAVKFPVDETS